MPKAIPNTYRHNHDGTVSLTINRRDGSTFTTMFDADDFDDVKRHQWWSSYTSDRKHIYATTRYSGQQSNVTLGRHVLDPKPPLETHYVNGDTLDCRRSNLVAATRKRIARDLPLPATSSSGERYIDRTQENRFKVRMPRTIKTSAKNRQLYVGTFATLVEAIAARDCAIATQDQHAASAN